MQKVESTNSDSAITPPYGKMVKGESSNDSMQSSHLMKLFEDELRGICWAEKALNDAVPVMIRNVFYQPELIDELTSHLDEASN